MQAVADEIVLVNVDPQKVITMSQCLNLFLETFLFWCHISYPNNFFQPPKTWNLAKLLDDFVSLGGNLLSGNLHKIITSSCSSITGF